MSRPRVVSRHENDLKSIELSWFLALETKEGEEGISQASTEN